ncbi:MAG: DUF4293 domain-containing protein [Bacteroidota bacterium]
MLQRSQTLYLLGIFILTVLLLTGSLARFATEEGELVLSHSGLLNAEGERELATWPMTILFALVSVISLLNIFFYRNRVRQMRLSVFLIFLFAGVTGMMFFYTWMVSSSFDTTATIYLWRFVIPPVSIILQYLAFRRIRRDELLVKAYDRIR